MSEEIHYVIVKCKFYETLLVPKSELLEVCDIIEDRCAIEKEDYEWHPMSGGFDTWCQSYAVSHGRGWSCSGELDNPIMVSGIYYLKE